MGKKGNPFFKKKKKLDGAIGRQIGVLGLGLGMKIRKGGKEREKKLKSQT